ncbi:Rpn family recombination-promoting nuclease/putative transposase [Vreelandella titanicae]|uniref:Rpn family recombination-promoting nuclease/putative transposase n=1 Tax=Vreelandella titanicae TaxID=664683 RepID=UPI0039BFED45
MVNNHHDTGYKELFSYPEFVQQLIEGFAPAEIARLMDFSTLKSQSGNYITPLFEEKIEDVVWSVNVNWQGLQKAVDRIVAIIQADSHKERIDKIITRWLKRHLQRLGAEVDLNQLNSLVEDKDMLAENLENWAQQERQVGIQEGEKLGIEKGEKLGIEKTARNLLKLGVLSDEQIAGATGLALEDVAKLRTEGQR